MYEDWKHLKEEMGELEHRVVVMHRDSRDLRGMIEQKGVIGWLQSLSEMKG